MKNSKFTTFKMNIVKSSQSIQLDSFCFFCIFIYLFLFLKPHKEQQKIFKVQLFLQDDC
jgi:hypothetical protein